MTSHPRSQPSIATGIRDHVASDHMRGCMGRQYSCTCGYDLATEETLKIAADRIEALEWRVIALEQVISEEMYPENCSDDANRMLLESAIESHGRRIKARSALSPSPTKGDGK